jgi:ABC-type sulfate/molybdate transport systems ATPase subunit
MLLSLHADIRRDGFALRVDLEIPSGGIIGLTGGIGSGKSTVLDLIAGRVRAHAGSVCWEDRVWDDPTTGVFVADRPVAIQRQLFQADLAEDRTGVENVMDAIAVHADVSDADGWAGTTRRVLADLGLQDHVVDRLPWTFSGAESQRVALARVLASGAPVVLLDEPFGALDKRTRQRVTEYVADWLSRHPGVAVIASSDVELLERIGASAVHLDG